MILFDTNVNVDTQEFRWIGIQKLIDCKTQNVHLLFI